MPKHLLSSPSLPFVSPPRHSHRSNFHNLLLLLRPLLLLSLLAALSRAQAQGRQDILTAHIIAHSHCDPGWLSTFEGYYTSDVNRILSGAMDQLVNDRNKRFVWAEISFFSRWYEDQALDRKQKFRELVQDGRWEFVGAGWAQNDEAASDLMLVVNQMTTGHQYLLENFGVQPRIGWQIDPFGHSSITPSLFRKMGFDALVINRIHHHKKSEYKAGRLMEFIWRGAGLGGNVDMFTHVLHTHYSAVKGFDWEEGAPQINGGNVEGRAHVFTRELKKRRDAYKSPHLLVPFGDDFKFKNAANQFQNMDALIRHINENSDRFGVRLRYSSLSEYFQAAHAWAQTSGADFPLFMGDFFPYADNEDSYWTGYYTTRPFLKKLSRQVEASMRSAEALYAIARANINANGNPAPPGLVDPPSAASHWMQTFTHIRTARREAGIFSHHDAITGTCRSHVANDYVARMNRALNTAGGLVESYLSILLTKNPSKPPKLTHASRVLVRGKKVHSIVVFNPLSWQRSEVVSVRVDSQHVYVAGANGTPVAAQVDRHWVGVNDAAPSGSEYTLRFFAQVPPLGAATFKIYVRSSPADAPPGLAAAEPSQVTEYLPGGGDGGNDMLRGGGDGVARADIEEGRRGDITIENEVYKVEISENCLIRAATDKREGGRRVQMDQTLRRYRTHKSGAYIFRPVAPAQPVAPSSSMRCRVFRGHVADVVEGVTGDGGFGVHLLLPRGGKVLNAMAIQQSLTVSVGLNEELVTYYQTDLKNQREVATHNGLEFVPRRSLMQGKKIARNFWPSVYGARIVEPNSMGLTILNSHAVGVGSQDEGHIEAMLHRQLNQDDGRGLSEAVRDASRPEVKLWYTLDKAPLSQNAFELHQLRLNNPLHVLFNAEEGGGGATAEEAASSLLPSFAPLNVELPPHIHLMSLMVRDGTTDEAVMRLRSLSAKAPEFRLPFAGDGDSRLFKQLSIEHVSENTLTGNHQGAVFDDALHFAVSKQTVDEATKRLDRTQRERQASQNTEEEGVFLSKSALERRSRGLLSLPSPEAVVSPGAIATYTIVLADPMSTVERTAWLEKVKIEFPDYAKALEKPSAIVFSPPVLSDSANPFVAPAPAQPQPPPGQPVSLRPPPPRQLGMPAAIPNNDVATPAIHLPLANGLSLPGVEDAKTSDQIRSNVLEEMKDSEKWLPSGFEYGFVMGAVTVCTLCLLLQLNAVCVCGTGHNTKKRR